jgi:signal transduction histidine kinase
MDAVSTSWAAGVRAARRLTEGRDWAPIAAIALGLIALVEASISADPNDRPIAMSVGLAATLPLALVHRRPRLVAVVITGAAFATLTGTVVPTGAAIVAMLMALYVTAEQRRWPVSALYAGPFVLNAIFPLNGDEAAWPNVLVLVLVVAALALGDLQRLRGQAIAERDESREQAAESLRHRVAMEERARIARELHDVVAHHVSMIAVQAETARLTTPGLPDQGRERLENIATTARDALAEMRRLLGVLREDARATAERGPQPGLERLDELIDEARDAGTTVRLTLGGRVVPVPPGIDLSAYRIVQEALTNARRHAPGASVDVVLRYDPDVLRIRVRDDGPGPANGGTGGHGLAGMRERAGLIGGTVVTGVAPEGGFLVEAELPIPAGGSEHAPPDAAASEPSP